MHVPSAGVAKEVSTLVSLADVTPTVLSALNITVPRQAQGRSLLPVIEKKEASESRSLYSETFLPRLHFNWSELRGLEMEKYHFIDAPKPELYDITADPHELRNLYSQKKAVSAQMKAKLDATIREYTPGTELAEKTALDPALMERLKSLGYAGFSGGGVSPQARELARSAVARVPSPHGARQAGTQPSFSPAAPPVAR